MGDRLVGQGNHLSVGAVLNGVAHEDPGHIKTEGPGLDLGSVGERDGGHHHRGNSPSLQVVDVVHTARRAGSSIGEGFYHRVAGGGYLVA